MNEPAMDISMPGPLQLIGDGSVVRDPSDRSVPFVHPVRGSLLHHPPLGVFGFEFVSEAGYGR